MDRINGADTIDIGGGRRGFRDENLVAGAAGTEVTALFLNMVQEEILKVVTEAGIEPSEGDWTQLWQALQILGLAPDARSRRWLAVISMTLSSAPGAPATGDTYLVPTGATGIWATHVGAIAQWSGSAWSYLTPPDGHGISLPDGRVFERIGGTYVEKLALDAQSGKWNYALAGGTANALTATLIPTPAALVAGMVVRLKVATTNTGAATLNVNGLGAVSILRGSGDALDAGELVAGDVVSFIYDGAAFRYAAANNVISTAITKTVYGAGADFVDLNAAMAWLSRRRISASGSVTLQIQAGQHVSAATQYLSHPDGARVFVVGGRGAAIPTYAAYARNGSSSGQRATDAAANLTMLRSVYTRELRFTGVSGILIEGQWGGLTDILISGDRTASKDGLSISGRTMAVTGVVAHGFGNYGITVNQSGFAQIDNCAVVYCGGLGGLTADDSGTIVTVNSFVVTGCDQSGVHAVNGGRVRVYNGTCTSSCNPLQGFNATGGGLINSSAGTTRAELNAAAGYFATGASNINVPNAYAGGNGIGFYADQRSFIYAANASGSGNTNGFSSYGGSYIMNTGSTLTGASTTPAVNTVGNNNSYIMN